MSVFKCQVINTSLVKTIQIDTKKIEKSDLIRQIAVHFNLRPNQIQIEDLPSEKNLKKNKGTYDITIIILNLTPNICFHFGTELIQIFNCYKQNFSGIIYQFNQQKIFFSQYLLNNLKFKLWDFELPREEFFFDCIPEGTFIKVEPREVIILNYKDYKFILKYGETASAAVDIIKFCIRGGSDYFINSLPDNTRLVLYQQLSIKQKYEVKITFNTNYYQQPMYPAQPQPANQFYPMPVFPPQQPTVYYMPQPQASAVAYPQPPPPSYPTTQPTSHIPQSSGCGRTNSSGFLDIHFIFDFPGLNFNQALGFNTKICDIINNFTQLYNLTGRVDIAYKDTKTNKTVILDRNKTVLDYIDKMNSNGENRLYVETEIKATNTTSTPATPAPTPEPLFPMFSKLNKLSASIQPKVTIKPIELSSDSESESNEESPKSKTKPKSLSKFRPKISDNKDEDENSLSRQRKIITEKVQSTKYTFKFNGVMNKMKFDDNSSFADNEDKIKERFDIDADEQIEYFTHDEDDDEIQIKNPDKNQMKKFKEEEYQQNFCIQKNEN